MIAVLILVTSQHQQALETVLFPSNIEDVSDHVVSSLEMMTDSFPSWITYAIRSLPAIVCTTKLRGESFLFLIRFRCHSPPYLMSFPFSS